MCYLQIEFFEVVNRRACYDQPESSPVIVLVLTTLLHLSRK